MESTELIDKYAGALATAMADTAPEAWRILVHGAVVDGWVALAVAAIAFVGISSSLWGTFHYGRKAVNHREHGVNAVAAPFMAMSVLVYAFMFVANIAIAANGILAPEREALREIMAVVK